MAACRPLCERHAPLFWAFVDQRGTDDCWIWTGHHASNGYGMFCVSHERKVHTLLAHRAAYELLVGPIPASLQMDHLCRVRDCVNPAHLEPVTRRENQRRGAGFVADLMARTHCKRAGHPLPPLDLTLPVQQRLCGVCVDEYRGVYNERRRRQWAARKEVAV